MRRPRGAGRSLTAIALASAGLILAGACLPGGPRRAGEGSHASEARLAPTNPARQIDLALSLRLPGRPALERFLRDVRDPSSPRYRGFMSANAFGARFGLSREAMDELERTLGAAGLRVTWRYPQRTSLGVRGTAASVGRLFGISFAGVGDAAGGGYRVPIGRPSIPPSLARFVTGVVGLGGRELMHHHRLSPDVPNGGLKPADTAKAYDIEPLWAAGIQGEGQTVAIMSLDSFRPSDVALFDSQTGIRGAPPVERVPVDGGAEVGDGREENALDIDVVRSVAPMARILNYEGKDTKVVTSIRVLNQIVSDGRASVISDSWGTCDDPSGGFSRAIRNEMDPILESAVAQGMTLFVASGDEGAYDCQAGNLSDQRLSVDWPSASPNAVSVGGTRLALASDGGYLTEFGWEDVLSHKGGGGGLNPIDPMPDWQRGPGVENQLSNGRRQVPDVAATADPDSGFFVVVDGQAFQFGGTSGAAPFWAASLVLVQQYARSKGAGDLGYANPALYELARTTQPFPPFHDVTRGGNRFFNAGLGWDFATGLGSPDVFNLARDVTAFLQQRSS